MNHKKCQDKAIKEYMKRRPTMVDAYFELNNVVSVRINGNKAMPSEITKTGQPMVYTYTPVSPKTGKKLSPKIKRGFMAHVFCPFCGKKY